MKKKGQGTTPINSVDRAFQMLEAFTVDEPELSLAELTKKLGFSRASVHRMLMIAQKHGFIEADPVSHKYRLSLKLFELGSIVGRRMELREVARPVMARLAAETGETVYLIIVHEDEALCIEKVDGDSYVRVLFLDVGKRMPLHIGAGPRVLMAYLPEEEVDRIIEKRGLQVWTRYTLADPKALKSNLAEIRAKGYCLSMEDVTLGAWAIGVPVRNHTGGVVAALSISGSVATLKDRTSMLIEMVRTAGVEISRRLGYTEVDG